MKDLNWLIRSLAIYADDTELVNYPKLLKEFYALILKHESLEKVLESIEKGEFIEAFDVNTNEPESILRYGAYSFIVSMVIMWHVDKLGE